MKLDEKTLLHKHKRCQSLKHPPLARPSITQSKVVHGNKLSYIIRLKSLSYELKRLKQLPLYPLIAISIVLSRQNERRSRMYRIESL